jgi:hypothetical protein
MSAGIGQVKSKILMLSPPYLQQEVYSCLIFYT